MIVIGRYRIYLDVAAALGGEVFNIPQDKWNSMTPDERWALNKEFLDQAIADSKTIRLATPPEKIPAGSTLEKELNYLASHGYFPRQIGIDHWEVVPEI